MHWTPCIHLHLAMHHHAAAMPLGCAVPWLSDSLHSMTSSRRNQSWQLLYSLLCIWSFVWWSHNLELVLVLWTFCIWKLKIFKKGRMTCENYSNRSLQSSISKLKKIKRGIDLWKFTQVIIYFWICTWYIVCIKDWRTEWLEELEELMRLSNCWDRVTGELSNWSIEWLEGLSDWVTGVTGVTEGTEGLRDWGTGETGGTEWLRDWSDWRNWVTEGLRDWSDWRNWVTEGLRDWSDWRN